MLTNFEAMVLHVYPDQGGVPTVCVGHVVKPEDHSWIDDGVTVDECRTALVRDVSRFEEAIAERVTVSLSQPMVDALVSLVFNIGAGAFETSSVLRFLNAGQYSDAADAFLLWRYVRVRQKDGTWAKRPILLGRREAEAKLFRSGIGEVLFDTHEPAPMPLDQILSRAVALQFPYRELLDADSPLPANDEDDRSEDGRLVALPPEREEKEAA